MNKALAGIIPVLICGLCMLRPGLANYTSQNEIKSNYPYASLAEEEIDMGIMQTGSNGDGYITLTNLGVPDLLIARVRSSCGLIIPTWPETPVNQGDTVNIRFRYNTSRLGPFERKVIIHTNAWQKNLSVTVTGEVIPEDQLEIKKY